jgi:trigger factor
MRFEQEVLDSLNIKVKVHVEPSDYQPKVDAAIKKYRKTFQMPGFRIGHVPASLVKQRFGKSILAEELNEMLQKEMDTYIRENQWSILGSPLPVPSDDVGNFDLPGNFVFSYDVGLAPAIHPVIDQSLKIEAVHVKVDDEMVDNELRDRARRYGKMHEPEVSGAHDMLLVKLMEQKEGGMEADTTVSLEFLKNEELKAELTGRKVGDEIAVNPRNLADGEYDLAKMFKRDVSQVDEIGENFLLRITGVRHLDPHPVDQELFDKLFGEGNVTTEDECRERLRLEVELQFADEERSELERSVRKALLQSIHVPLPDEFLKRFILASNEKPITHEILVEEYPAYADNLRWDLIETAILKSFDIQIGREDLVEHLRQMWTKQFAAYGLPLDEDRISKMADDTLSKPDSLKKVLQLVASSKVMEIILERCAIERKEVNFKEYLERK